ncbi:MAG: hypothetical protein Q9217_001930 [Psora testacea]
MEHEQPHAHLIPGPSDLSGELQQSSPTFLPSILLSVHHRPGYQRLTSVQEGDDIAYKGASGYEDQEDNLDKDPVHGLGIISCDRDGRGDSFGATVINKSSPNMPDSADQLRSPIRARSSKEDYSINGDSPDNDGQSTIGPSAPSSLYRPFTTDNIQENIRRGGRSSTLQSTEPTGNPGEPTCRTRRHFHHGRGNWLSVTILILSIYSTIFSGIWLGLAVAKPRYGKHITANGSLPPSTASLLCAMFAKTIELSFVTVFVTFLGQVLSQRAFVKNSRGITIAEMQMRVWIQQPGTLITHWETVRYAALSLLGAIALTAAFVAMLYTTASDALVAPKLKFGEVEDKVLYGKVKTMFGNQSHLVENCKTPMTNESDPWHYGPTCIAIEHSGQSYHNYAQYLGHWKDTAQLYNGSLSQDKRPIPVAMLHDNTTINGSWIEEESMPAVSDKYDRIVNNVTMAMPLTALFSAVRDPVNNILQPHDLNVSQD